METQTEIKKYSVIYDLLQDLDEYALAEIIEDKLKEKGYKVFVVRDKYKFKYVGEINGI